MLSARFAIGYIKMATGDYQSAIAIFEKWLQDYPPEALTRRVSKRVFRAGGRIVYVSIDRSKQKLFSSYASKLRFVERALAVAYVEMGRLDDSAALLNSVIERAALGSQGKEAGAFLLHQLDPYSEQAHWALFWHGCILAMRGDYRKSITFLEQSGLTSQQSRQRASGDIYKGFGLAEDAANHNTRVKIMLYGAYLKLGDGKRAAAALKEAFRENSSFFGADTQAVVKVLTQERLPGELPPTVAANQHVYSYIAAVRLMSANRYEEARSFLMISAETKDWWPYYLVVLEIAELNAGRSF